jgi:NADH-quinone oxidoreductase subunit N
MSFFVKYELARQFFFDLSFFMPEIFLGLNILYILLFGVFVATSRTLNFPLVQDVILYFVIMSIIGAFFLVLRTPVFLVNYCFLATLVFDHAAYFSKLFLYMSSIFCLLISKPFIIKYKVNNFEYFIIVLCSILGLSILISSTDFLPAYLAIELQALSFYVLACFQRKSFFSSEAGLKYFIVGAFSSGLLLYGISLLYGLSMSTSLIIIRLYFYTFNKNLFIIGCIFTFMGLLFKLAAFPGHMWAPDVYEGSPLSSTIFFSIVPKFPILIFFIRFLLSISPCDEIFSFLSFCGLGCLFVSSFGIIKQDNLKRVLAYSSIGHVGFILLALSTKTVVGIIAAFIYVLFYIFSSIPTWAVVIGSMFTKNSVKSKFYLSNLPGLFNSQPSLALLCCLGFFSFAGIPPLLGFFAKLSVYSSIIFCTFIAKIELICLIFVLTLPSTFYYIAVIKTLFFDGKLDEDWIFYDTLAKGFTVVITPSFLLLVFSYPSMFYKIAQLISSSFLF